MAEVTVIVALYNKAPCVRRCLESLCGQTLADLRIVVVDDGSTDEGPATVLEMASSDARIQLIRQENAGPAAARNVGIAAATSEFIGFVDADDWVEPTMYELLLAAARRSESVSARCGYSLEREGTTTTVGRTSQSGSSADSADAGGPTKIIRGGELYERLFAGPDISLMTACTAIYRRQVLAEQSILFDARLRHTEDALFNAEVYALDSPVAVVDEVLYRYRQSEDSLSKRHDSELYCSVDRLYERIASLEDSPNRTAQAGHAAFMRYICWYYAIAVADELADADSGAPGFAERIDQIRENSRLDEVFERANRDRLLRLPLRIVWYQIRKNRYGQLALSLRTFNFARTFRRAVGPRPT